MSTHDEGWENRANRFERQLAEARVECERLRGETRQAIHDFVERVNRRAEAEMQRTGTLEGAHHRAIEAELAALKGED